MRRQRDGLLIPVLFTLAGLAVLISLGTWQFERKAWKEALIATLNERLKDAPVELPPPSEWDKLTPENAEFRRVRLRAEFIASDALLYTSGSALRDDVKSQGYFVFSAARLPGGQTVVVNRGYTRELAYPERLGAEETVGVLRWPEPPSWFVAEHDGAARVWYARNHLLMARGRPGWGQVAPFYIEQESPVPPGGVPHPAALRVNLPNHHLQYGLTWYGLALVLAGVFAAWVVQRRRRPAGPAGPGR